MYVTIMQRNSSVSNMKIFMAGDSTMQFNDYSTFPQVGWAQVFVEFVKRDVAVRNYAKNGRSTKSFIEEGRLDEIMELISEGDFLFVQFGHNDQKIQDPSRYTNAFGTYQENLKKFIDAARSKKAIPVLLSSVYRRTFIDGVLADNVHFDYPEAMRQLCEKENVLYIDVCEETRKILAQLGDEKSKKLYMNFDASEHPLYAKETNDNTHLRYDGGFMVSKIVAEALKKAGEPYSNVLCAPIKANDIFVGGRM